jgi:hypothetical protein
MHPDFKNVYEKLKKIQKERDKKIEKDEMLLENKREEDIAYKSMYQKENEYQHLEEESFLDILPKGKQISDRSL